MAAGRGEYRNKYTRGYHNYSQYNSESTAYELAPEILPNEEPLRKQYQRKGKYVKKQKPKTRKVELYGLKIAGAIAILFLGCIVTMVSYAKIAQKNVAISNLKQQIAAVQVEITSMQAEIADEVDLEYVEREAINRLGMSAPKSHQMVYIDVPNESYTVQYSEDEAPEEKKSTIGSILNFIKKD